MVDIKATFEREVPGLPLFSNFFCYFEPLSRILSVDSSVLFVSMSGLAGQTGHNENEFFTNHCCMPHTAYILEINWSVRIGLIKSEILLARGNGKRPNTICYWVFFFDSVSHFRGVPQSVAHGVRLLIESDIQILLLLQGMGKIRWLTPQTRLTVYLRYKTFSSTPVARYNRRFCRVRTGHGKPGRSWNLRI